MQFDGWRVLEGHRPVYVGLWRSSLIQLKTIQISGSQFPDRLD